MSPAIFQLPRLLLPAAGIDTARWAVIACDQFTAAPEYWEETARLVGKEPSCLQLTLPEVYLSQDDTPRIGAIHRTMADYLSQGVLREQDEGLLLLARDCGRGCPRRGVLLAFDLEAYDEQSDPRTPIRPTEATVTERVPPRLAIRAQAPFELPHIILFLDDPNHTVLEPLFADAQSVPPLYDIELMQGGGRLTERFLPQNDAVRAFLSRLTAHCTADACRARYGLSSAAAPLAFATGDGNHSMSAAKAHWERLKQSLTADERQTHPARFVLAELVNLWDESICFEAVHRLLLHAHAPHVLSFLARYFTDAGYAATVEHAPQANTLSLPWRSADADGFLVLRGTAPDALPVALLQGALDAYLAANPTVGIDFIHGTHELLTLAGEPDRLGFLLPDFGKEALFPYVLSHGVLPRKTFSMGTALEKRYYLEGRRIR